MSSRALKRFGVNAKLEKLIFLFLHMLLMCLQKREVVKKRIFESPLFGLHAFYLFYEKCTSGNQGGPGGARFCVFEGNALLYWP